MIRPAKEKSVSPKLASNSPEQITSTTNTILNVIASNLKITAQNRILEEPNPIMKRKQRGGYSSWGMGGEVNVVRQDE